MGIRAGSADGVSLFRAEEPVQSGHDHGGQHDQQRQRVVQRQRADVPLAQQQVILIHADGLIALAAHDPQIDGVQRQLGQDTGQNGGDAAPGVKESGGQTGQHAGCQCAQHGKPRVHARPDQHHAHRAAGGQRAVHRQVGHVQNTEGDVNADGHNAPGQSLGDRAGQRVHQRGKETHRSCSFDFRVGEDAACILPWEGGDQSSMAV